MMAGIAVNTMIEDHSIECEDSKILNTDHENQVKTTSDNATQDLVSGNALNNAENSETEKLTTLLPSRNDASTKEESSTASISSQLDTVVENANTTAPKSVTFSDVSDDADTSSLKYFDEIYSIDKKQSTYEPEWAGAVGRKGDVFYVEGGEPRPSRDQPTMQTPHSNSTNHAEESNSKGVKSKKGIRKKVKTLITANKKDSNSTGVKQEQKNNLRNGIQQNSQSPSVTFNDRPTGMIKDVRLFVDPNRNNYGRRASLCESLFGIVPGHFSSKPEMNGTSKDNRIMVQALLPGNEAIKSGDIKIGDWLMCVNNTEINLDNMDNILSTLSSPMHVKLTLQKLTVLASPPHLAQKRNNNEDLVKLVSGERLNIPQPSLHDLVHGVLYLTLDVSQDSAQAKEDILYEFGVGSESKLLDIRGLFTTLTHVLLDVTSNTAKNSTLLVDGQLVHVGYKKDNREVFVIAVPAHKMCTVEVKKLVDDMTRVLKVLYGSLHSAFNNNENHGRLDHLFSLVFQRALLAEELLQYGSRQTQFIEPLFDILPGVRAVSLPEETKVLISNSLSELEAADFVDMSEDYYDLRRSYCILGSCLFYKGYLTHSHLPKEDLYDVYLYLKYHCLLTLCNEEQMGQLVVWSEVFPWRRCHMPQDPLIPGYIEPDARWFLLVVGMKNSMLTVLLEAGGCAEWAEGHPSPDPFYVDQVKATLLQLESLDVPNQCEIRLLAPAVPSLSSIDWFFPHNKSSKDDTSTHQTPHVKVHLPSKTGAVSPSKKLLQPESILKKRSNTSPRGPRGYGRGAIYDVESDEVDSQSTGNSDNSTPIMDRRHRKPSVGSDESAGSAGSSGLFKGNKKKRTMLSAYDVSGLKRGLAELTAEDGSFVKLTSGCDNTLFHYVQLDEQEGVFICPTQQELVQITTATHGVLLANFHTACLAIHQILNHAAKVQEVKSSGEVTGKFGLDDSLGNVYEHGILFQSPPHTWTDPKKSPPTTSYWVVGRRLKGLHPREFYVCFHDSAQQNLVELAFKLGFGLMT